MRRARTWPAARELRRRFRSGFFRNRNLRWLELAWSASIVGHWAFLVAVSVYAFEQGGARAVGLIFLLRLVPAGIVSPSPGCSPTATRGSACSS